MKHQQFEPQITEGEFTLWVNSPIYKIYAAGAGYIRNTKTQENCGKEVILRKHLYLNGQKLSEPIYDEDCYEIVPGEPK